jgi:hypothetical protein
MSRKIRFLMVTALVVAALSAVTTGTVFAQDEEPTPAPAPYFGHGMGRGMGGQVGLEAAAEVLGMTADDLALELWGGATLSDLAEEKGVDLQTIQDAVNAANDAAKGEAIEQAVEDGTITREHADWLLEGLDNGYLGGHEFGHFGGRGGMRGFGDFGRSGTHGFPGTGSSLDNADA